MWKRREEYDTYYRHARKLFSESQKRVIACYQKYMCFGAACNGKVLLPTTWELDHKIPLFEGGSNEYPFDNPGPNKGNLVIICSSCHATKTQRERQEFFAKERNAKYGELEKFQMADDYYVAKSQTYDSDKWSLTETSSGKQSKVRSKDRVSPYFQHLEKFRYPK